MIALEHLQTNALLIVLFGALLTLFTLRVAVYLSQRARVARDLAIIDSLTISKARVHGLKLTPHAEPITRASHSDSLTSHSVTGASMPGSSAPHSSTPRTSMPDAAKPHAAMPDVSMPGVSTADVSAARPRPARASVDDSAASLDAGHDARPHRAHLDPLQ